MFIPPPTRSESRDSRAGWFRPRHAVRGLLRKGRETLDKWRREGIPDGVVRQIEYRAHQFRTTCGASKSEVEDFASDLLLALWAAIPKFQEGTAKVSTFSRGVLDKQYKKMLRKRLTRRRALARRRQLEPRPNPLSIDRGPRCGFEDADLLRAIASRIGELDADLRDVAELLPTHSPSEIAAELGIHRGTVHRRIDRIREQFADLR